MLCFNFTLGKSGFYLTFILIILLHDTLEEQRKMPNCTKGKIKPPHVHSFPWLHSIILAFKATKCCCLQWSMPLVTTRNKSTN